MKNVPIFSLVYASEETRPLSEQELDALLAASRANNQQVGLTGMLLCKDGSFMQALEGDEKSVRKTFRRISRDRRHSGVRVLSATEVSARQFGEWSMGYRRVAEDAPAVSEGYNDFLSRGDLGPSWGSPTPARVLLDWFRLYAGRPTASAPPSLFAMR
jgi:Sensors of blue-light using FAD